MSAKVRILALRLLKKQKENPELTKRLGIDVKMVEKSEKKENIIQYKGETQ